MDDQKGLLQNIQDNYFEFEKIDERKISEPSLSIFNIRKKNSYRLDSCGSGITYSELSTEDKEVTPFSLKLNEIDSEEVKDTITELQNNNFNISQLKGTGSQFSVSMQ